MIISHLEPIWAYDPDVLEKYTEIVYIKQQFFFFSVYGI